MYSVLCAHIIIVISFLLERPFSASAFLMKTWIIHIHIHEEWSRLKNKQTIPSTLPSQQVWLVCLFQCYNIAESANIPWMSIPHHIAEDSATTLLSQQIWLTQVYWSTHTLQHCWVSKYGLHTYIRTCNCQHIPYNTAESANMAYTCIPGHVMVNTYPTTLLSQQTWHLN